MQPHYLIISAPGQERKTQKGQANTKKVQYNGKIEERRRR